MICVHDTVVNEFVFNTNWCFVERKGSSGSCQFCFSCFFTLYNGRILIVVNGVISSFSYKSRLVISFLRNPNMIFTQFRSTSSRLYK